MASEAISDSFIGKHGPGWQCGGVYGTCTDGGCCSSRGICGYGVRFCGAGCKSAFGNCFDSVNVPLAAESGAPLNPLIPLLFPALSSPSGTRNPSVSASPLPTFILPTSAVSPSASPASTDSPADSSDLQRPSDQPLFLFIFLPLAVLVVCAAIFAVHRRNRRPKRQRRSRDMDSYDSFDREQAYAVPITTPEPIHEQNARNVDAKPVLGFASMARTPLPPGGSQQHSVGPDGYVLPPVQPDRPVSAYHTLGTPMSAGSEVSGAASVSQISSDNSRSGSAPRNSVRFADDNTIGYSALAAGAAVAGGAALATHSNSKQRQEKVPSLAGNVARSSVSLDRDDRNNMDFSAGDQYISNGMGSDLAARNTARNAAILPIGNNEAPISKLGNVRSSASASDNRIGNLQGASASGISNRDAAFLAGGVGAGAIAGAAVANSGNAAPKTAGNVRKQTTQTTTSIRQTSTTRNYVASAVGSGADGSKSLPSAPVQHTGAVPLAAVATSNGSDSNELEEDGFAPPAPTSHVVTDPYFPTRPDEMRLHPGDLIGIQVIYSDHWARGQNISQGRRRVVFPLSHVVPMKNGPSQTPKGSWSTQHSNESNPPSKKPVSERTTSLAKQL